MSIFGLLLKTLMQLTKQAITEMKEALSFSYGIDFTEEEAEAIGMKLINLYEAILKTNHGEE